MHINRHPAGGWQVRFLPSSTNAHDISRYFGDNKYYGNIYLSLAHALEFRDQMADLLKK